MNSPRDYFLHGFISKKYTSPFFITENVKTDRSNNSILSKPSLLKTFRLPDHFSPDKNEITPISRQILTERDRIINNPEKIIKKRRKTIQLSDELKKEIERTKNIQRRLEILNNNSTPNFFFNQINSNQKKYSLSHKRNYSMRNSELNNINQNKFIIDRNSIILNKKEKINNYDNLDFYRLFDDLIKNIKFLLELTGNKRNAAHLISKIIGFSPIISKLLIRREELNNITIKNLQSMCEKEFKDKQSNDILLKIQYFNRHLYKTVKEKFELRSQISFLNKKQQLNSLKEKTDNYLNYIKINKKKSELLDKKNLLEIFLSPINKKEFVLPYSIVKSIEKKEKNFGKFTHIEKLDRLIGKNLDILDS